MSLFRQEALEKLKNKQYGDVLINLPLHMMGVSLVAILIFLTMCLFFCFAEFRERTLVKGVLSSSKGLVSIVSKRPGIIIKKFIKQGDFVTKGSPLFLIDTSVDHLAPHKNKAIIRAFEKREQVLNDEIAYKSNHLKLLKPLLLKQYISSVEYREKYDEMLALKNKKALLSMEYLQYKQSRAYTIRAPIDGVVSSVVSHIGQFSSLSKPLATLLPDGAEMLAELYVPVSQIRFLSLDQPIVLRFDAYPYQHFGTGQAKLYEVSQTALTDEVDEKNIKIGEPYYKAHAYLNKMIFGSEATQALKLGMTYSAEILGAKKTVGRWLFDSIYTQQKEHRL